LLTGKFAKGHEFEKADHRVKNKLFEPENFQRVQQALDRLRPIAEKKAASLAQLALAWVMRTIWPQWMKSDDLLRIIWMKIRLCGAFEISR
jgi:aryl-alcohol dehydrogenase-like predicted oxidoreductase